LTAVTATCIKCSNEAELDKIARLTVVRERERVKSNNGGFSVGADSVKGTTVVRETNNGRTKT
jgi:hypothetical protein